MEIRTFSGIGTVVALIASLGGAWADTAVAAGPNVLEPGIKHYGKSYNDLTGDWWQWVTQFPLATNPILENGTLDCTRGQSGKIWFIAGNFGGAFGEANPAHRSCTIPSGKALFFPLANSLFWVPEDGATAAAVRTAANAGMNAISGLEVMIDGVAVADPFAYRAQTQPGGFALTFAPLLADFGFSAQPDPRKPAVADGYWILLAPLHNGEHTIRFRASAVNFALDVTYGITVKGNADGLNSE